MSFLPTKYAIGLYKFENPVIAFLQAYEPDDKEEARKFREALMESINHYLPGSNKVMEHPDSLYLEP